MIKRTAAAAMAGIMAVLLAACGGKDKENSGRNLPEYTYVPEYVNLGAEGGDNAYINLYTAKYADGNVYYSSESWQEETGESVSLLHEYSLEQKKDLRTWSLSSGSGENDGNMVSTDVRYWDILKNGDLLTLCQKYTYSEEESKQEYLFRLIGSDGSVKMEKEFGSKLKDSEEDYLYFNGMAADGEGRIYLAGEEGLYLFDKELNYAGQITSDSWINSVGVGKDGRVYCSSYDNMSENGGYVLYRADFDKKTFSDKYSNFTYGNFSAGIEKDFLVSDSNDVFEYDLGAQKLEKLFSWVDSDIIGNNVEGIFPMEDGKIAALIEDNDADERSVAILTKTKTSDLPAKEQIVLGVLYPSTQYSSQVVAFNKQSDKYHVTMKTYYDTTNNSEDAYNEAITAFNNALLSADAPDIIALEGIQNVGSLANKGVFEDLGKYLDKSSTIKKSDIFENIIESNTYNGKLISIPKTFQIMTLAGKTSNVGEKRGWTIDDLAALADKNPGSQIFNYVTKDTMMYYMVLFNTQDFIDYDTGECYFNTPEFKKILELSNRFPAETNYDSDVNEQELLATGKTLLEAVNLSEFNEIQVYEAEFGEPVTYVGFPTSDGKPGSVLMGDSGFAIASKSKVKEGAWEFVEFYLNRESDWYSYGFSSFKSKFDKEMEEATKVEYLTDENGDFVLDENGEKIVINGGGGIGFNGWTYEYHICTKEEAQLAKEIAQESSMLLSVDEQMLNIMSEEAAPFFNGQKTADEVAEIIQSRIKLYINE